MLTSKIFLLMFALLSTPLTPYHQEAEDAISSLRVELDQLKSKVSFLESSIENSKRELKSKDESIAQMDKIILEKEKSISSLKNYIDSLQQEGTVDAKRQVNEPRAHVVELENQVDKVRREIEMLGKEKVELEVRANMVDKKTRELHLKLENEEMMKSKLDAFFMESVDDYQGWLPRWLVVRLHHFQSYIVARWNYSWRPALDESFQKILIKFSQSRADTETYIETIKLECISVMKDQLLAFISYLKSHVESLQVRSIVVYHAFKNSVLLPSIKEAYRFAKPYMYQLKTLSKPYLDKALITLKPFAKKVVSYHEQIQQLLKTNELTRSLATKDLSWFLATVLLYLPMLLVLTLASAISRKRGRKSRRNSHTHQARRSLKRPYPY